MWELCIAAVYQTDSDTKLLYCEMLRFRMSEHGPSTRSKRVRSIFTHFSSPRATTVAALGRSSNSAISPVITYTQQHHHIIIVSKVNTHHVKRLCILPITADVLANQIMSALFKHNNTNTIIMQTIIMIMGHTHCKRQWKAMNSNSMGHQVET